MPAESCPIAPAVLQQLSNDVIKLYRGAAEFSKRAVSGGYAAAQGEAEEELNRLLALTYTVFLKYDDFIWFRHAHAHNAFHAGTANRQASWHDTAALNAGRILWEALDTPAPRFPPQQGDPEPAPVLLGTNWEYLEMGRPGEQLQLHPAWSDEDDGWEARRMERNLQAEAALAAKICAAEAAGGKGLDWVSGAIEPDLEAARNHGQTPKAVRKRRSTVPGEARTKWVSYLTTHHKYENGHCSNLEPVGANEVAREAKISEGRSSTLFKEEFGGYADYMGCCRDQRAINKIIRRLNDDAFRHDLYNQLPDDAGVKDDDDTVHG